MKNTNQNPIAYEGNEPYIFVSYAHKDAARVLPIILKMQEAGLRVWYDEGIEAGAEWPEYIETHLVNAECVVAFISEAAVSSLNCRNEINLALLEKKKILVVYLEEAELRYGMRLQLSSVQSILLYQGQSEQKICDMPLLSSCKAGAPLKACGEAIVTTKERIAISIGASDGAVVAALKNKIQESSADELTIKSLKKLRRASTFTLAPNGEGVCVPQLNGYVLKWLHFERIVERANALGGKMYRADDATMNGGRLGDEVPYDSMEGFIASELLGAKEGSAVTRRSTYYSGILAWAGVVTLHKSEGEGSYITVNEAFRGA